MKKYNINVNGKMYQVEVEEVNSSNSSMSAPTPVTAPTPVAAPTPTPVATPAPAAAPTGAMTSPMPGTIIDIKVSEGQLVKSGEVLMILEAMKMENEIVAPSDGKVAKIHTTKGAAVSTGDALITLG